MAQHDDFQYDFIDNFGSNYEKDLGLPEFIILFAQYKRAMHETIYQLNRPGPIFFIQQKENNSNSTYY